MPASLASAYIECGDGGAPSARFRRRVPVRHHKAGTGQRRTDEFALHSDAAAVNDADGAESHPVRLFQVGLDHPLDVARRHAVQVEDIRDGDPDQFVGICKIGRHIISLYERGALAAKYTYKQGQYLAFIHMYTKLYRRAPAESDIQMHFRVTPPSVHQMIMTLEARGLISRIPWTPRSIQVLVPIEELPELD